MFSIRSLFLKLTTMIPYGPGSYALSLLFGSKMMRKLFFRPRERVLRTFLNAIGSSVDFENASSQSLVSNKFIAWRLTAISRAYDKGSSKWVHIEGLQNVEDNYRSRQRLIVINGHYGIPRMAPQLLSRMGYQIQSLAARAFYDGLDLPEWKQISVQQLRDSQFFAKDIFVASKAIKAGKIFHTLADGAHGKAVLELPFLGRVRRFTKSYANLALSSGADVIPVFTRVELSGHITVKFCPPLDQGTEDMAPEDRVSRMVRQYVSLLSDEYEHDPGSVHLKHMTRYLDCPPSDQFGAQLNAA